ncbi:hypothetical protein L204_106267 [Cryptococcus depauperatus]|nr:hypothetical protein L204_05831 [Cryptococcus depauperatus CBS 7855]
MASLLEESHPKASLTKEPDSHPLASPIQSYQLCQSISGNETELLIQTFEDRIFVVVTQNGKVGCLTQASLSQFTPLLQASLPTELDKDDSPLRILSVLPSPPPQMKLTPLLGSPPQQTLHELYVSQIATLIWWALQTCGQPRRSVVVGLALQKGNNQQERDEDEQVLADDERERYAGIMDMVSQWSGPSQ